MLAFVPEEGQTGHSSSSNSSVVHHSSSQLTELKAIKMEKLKISLMFA
jgi:hypothetical protein